MPSPASLILTCHHIQTDYAVQRAISRRPRSARTLHSLNRSNLCENCI